MVLSLNDVEENIFLMDTKYDANFGEWIRNEENARIIGHHMRKYIDDYGSADFIIVLKWVVKDWTLRNIIVMVQKMVIVDFIDLNDGMFILEKDKKYKQRFNRNDKDDHSSRRGRLPLRDRNLNSLIEISSKEDEISSKEDESGSRDNDNKREDNYTNREDEISSKEDEINSRDNYTNRINDKQKDEQNDEKLTKYQTKKRIEILRGLIFTWNPIFISEFINCVSREFTDDKRTLFAKALLQDINTSKLTDIVERLVLSGEIKNIENLKLPLKRQYREKELIEAYNAI